MRFAFGDELPTGMRTERLFTAHLGLPDAAYPKNENVVGFYEQLLSRIKAIPGVESAAMVWPLPLSGSVNTSTFDIEEHPLPEGQQHDAVNRMVTPDCFKTMGIPVRQGRGFEETDDLTSLPVVIVNERFAEKYFPGENAIGKRIKPSWAASKRSSPLSSPNSASSEFRSGAASVDTWKNAAWLNQISSPDCGCRMTAGPTTAS